MMHVSLIQSVKCSALCLIVMLMAFNSISIGQVMLLPGPSGFIQGDGQCSDFLIGIYSERWRVRKGEVFDVSAAQPFVTDPLLKYVWTVSNGKIVSGQGTPTIQIRAGSGKTGGYINVSGFVSITLIVDRIKNGQVCTLETSNRMFIGEHREVNRRPNVDALKLDRGELNLPCQSGLPNLNSTGSMIIDVTTLASDAEGDILTYIYIVSGGTILGDGSKIKWDLSGVEPGRYTIHAGVDDGYGMFGKTQSRTIAIMKCAG